MANLAVVFNESKKKALEVAKAETLSDTEAITAAKALLKEAEDYRNALCASIDRRSLKEILGGVKIQFPIAYNGVELLRTPQLQCSDCLKEVLSESTRIFVELIVCEFRQQKRKMYEGDQKKLYAAFKEMAKSAPKNEVLFRYNVKCCRAAMKYINRERVTDIIKGHIGPLTFGAASVLFSVNASATQAPINPLPLLPPIARLVYDVYNSLPEFWYKDVLALKLMGIEARLRALDQYVGIPPGSERSDKSIQKILQKAQEDPKCAFYICQAFNAILKNDDVESDLKGRIFADLAKLAQYYTRKSKRKIKDQFKERHWEVRYYALTCLKDLADNVEYKESCYKVVTIVMFTKDERRVVREKAHEICTAFLHGEQEVYIDFMRRFLDDTSGMIEQAYASEGNASSISEQLTLQAKQVKDLEAKINQYKSSEQSSKPPEKVVAQETKKLEDAQKQAQKLERSLNRLEQLEYGQQQLSRVMARLEKGLSPDKILGDDVYDEPTERDRELERLLRV